MSLTDHPFIMRFAEAWADATLESLMAPLADDVILIQPLSSPLIGKPAARKAFAKTLFQYPGMRGEDVTGLGAGDHVFINWTMCVSIGRHELRIPVVDDVELTEGLVKKRTAYFDVGPIMKTHLMEPTSWPRQIRSAFKKF